MKAKWLLTTTALLVLLAALALGPASAHGVMRQPSETRPVISSPAGAGIAGRPVGRNFLISQASPDEKGTAIAYNSQSKEYLVAFWNDRPANDDIRAERVGWDGKLLGGKWVAAGAGAERWYPDVAYNSQRNEYLVVWQEIDGLGYVYIRAQRLSADAQLVGGVIDVASGVIGMSEVGSPVVDYASTADKYLVVWDNTVGSANHIIGRVVSSDGVPAGSSFYVSEDTTMNPRSWPDLAYNRHGNGYLVVWQQWDWGTSLFSIHGQLVHGDGFLTGSPIAISSHSKNSRSPAVAAIPTGPSTYKYLVVYEYEFAFNDVDIRGRLVEENGTVAPDYLQLANTVNNEYAPAVAGPEMGDQFLVAWAMNPPSGQPILACAVSSDGSSVGLPDPLGGDVANSPAISAGPSGDFLVAWQDVQPGFTDFDIFGRIWGIRAYLPVVVRD